MPQAPANAGSLTSIPIEFWIWAGGTVLLAAALGFVAGMSYARVSVEWAAKRAQKQLATLYTLVVEALSNAHNACQLLEKFPKLVLSVEQTDALDQRRTGLMESLGQIVETQREIVKKQKEKAAAAKVKLDEAKFTWIRTPEDYTTSLPAKAAFDANLAQLLQYGTATQTESGLLLVKIDKADQLKARFGGSGIENFVKKMAMVVIRSIRDQDIVCRYSPDTFAVLLPDIDDESGLKLAHAIRNAVRNHHFRLDENGPEVLVTASFGYTRCPVDDRPEMAIDRADDALSKSLRRGRNQLHAHDGGALLQCVGA